MGPSSLCERAKNTRQEHCHACKQMLKVLVSMGCLQLTIWVARGVEVLKESNGLSSHDTTFCFEVVGLAAGSVTSCLPAERYKQGGLGLKRLARCFASRPLVHHTLPWSWQDRAQMPIRPPTAWNSVGILLAASQVRCLQEKHHSCSAGMNLSRIQHDFSGPCVFSS